MSRVGEESGVRRARTGGGHTIAALAAQTGLTMSSVRYYVRQGLLHGDRDRRGQWSLDISSPARIAFIRRAQDQGLTLPEIAALLHPDHGRGRRLELAAEVEQRVATLQAWRAVLAADPLVAEEGRAGPDAERVFCS